MTRPTHTVRAERVGRWWALTVPEVPGAVTQVRSLSQAEEYAREAIAFVLDVPPESFDLSIDPALGGLEHEVREVRHETHRAEQAQRLAAEHARSTVRKLKEAGLSGSDIAAVLRVSTQRVSQLLAQAGVPTRVRKAG